MPGMPNFPAVYALRAGKPLMRDLRHSLAERGFQLLRPAGTQFASGIVSFAHESPEWLGSQPAARGAVVWAGDGRVRVSMHLYNGQSDLEKFFTALDTIDQRV